MVGAGAGAGGAGAGAGAGGAGGAGAGGAGAGGTKTLKLIVDLSELFPPKEEERTVYELLVYPLPPPPPPPSPPEPPVAPVPPVPPLEILAPSVEVIVYPGLNPLLIKELCGINV